MVTDVAFVSYWCHSVDLIVKNQVYYVQWQTSKNRKTLSSQESCLSKYRKILAERLEVVSRLVLWEAMYVEDRELTFRSGFRVIGSVLEI